MTIGNCWTNLLRPERNEAYALKSEDFQSPTFYGEHEDGNVKCLNYKLTHYYRDSSAIGLNNSSFRAFLT